MNVTLHFFRKDLRLLRWPLVFLFAEAIGVILWYSMLPLEGRVTHIAALSLWRYVIWGVCFMMGGLVQRDAPLREAAFFRTKPVALHTVLQAKGLILLCVVVLFAAIETLSLLLLGLKPGILNLLLIFAEELLLLAALTAVGMMLAPRQESAGKYL